MYRTPTARLLAKKNATSATALLVSSSTKKKTIVNPVKITTPQHDDPCQTATTTKEHLRAQLLDNQRGFLSYMASVVEERDALRQENGILREQQRQQAVDENIRTSRIRAFAKEMLAGRGGSEEEEELLLSAAPTISSSVPSSSNTAGSDGVAPAMQLTTKFKPKKHECVEDFIVGDTTSGFRCGLCLEQHGDASCYWSRNSCYYHIRRFHKVQPKANIPLPKVDYDPTKDSSREFFERVGQNRWRCKVCAGVGREMVVKSCSTSGHLRSMHMRKKNKK